MKFKKLIKSFLLLTLTLSCVPLTNISAIADDTVSSSSTTVSGEGDSDVTTPAETESIDVSWCAGERYATGYAINKGYTSTPVSVDTTKKSPIKAYLSDKCYTSFSSAYSRVKEMGGSEDKVPVIIDTTTERIAYAQYGVVYLNNSSSSATFSIHVAANSEAKKTYVNATSQRDALLLDINSTGEWAKVMISGVTGFLKLTNSSGTYVHQIIPLTFLDTIAPSYDGTLFSGYRLTRYGLSVQDSTAMYLDVLRGSKESYLVNSGYADKINNMQYGKVYYSYDGHYFYDSIFKMINDYRAEHNNQAINSKPFYNYYQYLPARAKTNMVGSDFDAYLLLNKPTAGDNVTYCYSSSGSTTSCSGSYAYKYSGPSSILYNSGSAFLKGQANYGINGALIYVKATLEGAYGMSTIARAKYNPFGVNAVDSAPFSSATKYSSVYEGIEAQFQKLMSLGYVNPYDSGGRYNGSHVGDKESGCNTMYASDPNWGFKLASLYRSLDKMSGYKDLNYYQLGVTTVPNAVIYSSANGSNVKQLVQNYETKNNYLFDSVDIPVIIVGKEGNRYKIVMDAPSDQTTGYYYASESDYGYIDASSIYLINSSTYRDPANVGDKIDNTTSDLVTFDTPLVLTTNNSVKLYDSYRTDISSSFTTISASRQLVAIRTLTSKGIKYYEVITDYSRTPYKTMWVQANDVSVSTTAKLVFTQASSLNCRSNASTSAASLGLIGMERAPLIYETSTSGTDVNGNTTWYKVLYEPLSANYGYISGAYASIGNSGNDGGGSVSTATKNVVRSMFFNDNPYFFGTGVVDGVNVSDVVDMKYELVMSDGVKQYTYPLSATTTIESLTASQIYNPGNKYNYDFAWYEGSVKFTSVIDAQNKTVALPSGNYKLSIRATSANNTSTFPVVNANKLSLSGSVKINDKMSYTITQSNSYELSVNIVNEGFSGASNLDLTPYSLMDMSVYDNSRVTSVKKNNTGFTVEGYMFEKDVNVIYSDTRNWREIVFVNANNTSSEFAYRKQTTAVYNTWLNKNQTATVNGKYKLNYANYKVSVDPNKINAYVKNVPNQKMVSGDYLVYMRISNGKTSFLFPLRDITLSDGTNMENTNSLPEGFSVYDSETRALMYSVK